MIDYVVKKYGYNQVAQIVTYGTMAAKSAIKDVARVMDLPLPDANALAKLVPDKPTYNMTLNRIFTAPLEGEGSLMKKEGIAPEELDNVKKMRAIALGNDSASECFTGRQDGWRALCETREYTRRGLSSLRATHRDYPC